MLETRLHCWTPRRPSAGLERRLFGGELPAPRAAIWLGWLAPAMACLLFAGLVLHPPDATRRGNPLPQGAWVGAILSNQDGCRTVTASLTGRQYRLEPAEWTNGNVTAPSNQSLAPVSSRD